MRMRKVELKSNLLEAAWINWCSFFDNDVYWTMFLDFIDPVRQFDIGILTDSDVSEQTYKRVEFLAGPHWYAYLKANPDQLERAATSWGKQVEAYDEG